MLRLFVCVFLLSATAAVAQEPLPPAAFGTLGMYPERLSCADSANTDGA